MDKKSREHRQMRTNPFVKKIKLIVFGLLFAKIVSLIRNYNKFLLETKCYKIKIAKFLNQYKMRFLFFKFFTKVRRTRRQRLNSVFSVFLMSDDKNCCEKQKFLGSACRCFRLPENAIHLSKMRSAFII